MDPTRSLEGLLPVTGRAPGRVGLALNHGCGGWHKPRAVSGPTIKFKVCTSGSEDTDGHGPARSLGQGRQIVPDLDRTSCS